MVLLIGLEPKLFKTEDVDLELAVLFSCNVVVIPPISNDLLILKGTIGMSVFIEMELLLLLELKIPITDRVAKLLTELGPWNVVVPSTVTSDWVVIFIVSDVKFWTTNVELGELLLV